MPSLNLCLKVGLYCKIHLKAIFLKLRHQWIRSNFKAESYDIKHSYLHDIVTKNGFYFFLTLCLQSLELFTLQ